MAGMEKINAACDRLEDSLKGLSDSAKAMNALKDKISLCMQLITSQPSAVHVNGPFPWEREENVVVPRPTSGNTETRESEVLDDSQPDNFQDPSLQTDAF